MAIGVKETQDIIRKAAAVSRSEATAPARLEPQEVGMVTGPRKRRRMLMRAAEAPDYLRPSDLPEDEWQRLDDDIYKFICLRQDQFGRLPHAPSQQFIAEMEARLKFGDADYGMGTFLGLLRLAADLDQTGLTHVTASEKGVFQAFARRLTDGRRPGENFDPACVRRYLELMGLRHPPTFRALADFFRLVSRAARLPLLAQMREASTLTITVMLQVIDMATRFNQNSEGQLEFKVGPMDVFLGARSVLCNRSVAQPTLSIMKELVLEETGLYHHDMLEWLRSVGVFGSDLTLFMPDSLSDEGFALMGSRYSALEMVMAAGHRLAAQSGSAERVLSTLSDAILFKIQQQDSHKDRQVQSILGHFNRLIQGERRSAARVSQERQQARFDYVSAIEKAGQLVREIQTGQFHAFDPVRDPMKILPLDTLGFARQGNDPFDARQPAAALLAGLMPDAYERILGEWDGVLGRIRKKLTAKSPVFKSMVSQLARVRALDTCLVHGLTPTGGRLTSRFSKLLRGDELCKRLGLIPEVSQALEEIFTLDYPAFLGSLESLILGLYAFRPDFQGIQFRLRDRLGGENPHADFGESDEAGLDDTVIKLVLGSLLLSQDAEASGMAGRSPASRFQADGSFCFPGPEDIATLGRGDPFRAFGCLLWAGKESLPRPPWENADAALALFSQLSRDKLRTVAKRYRDLATLGDMPMMRPAGILRRSGWETGFEMGFMAEIRLAWEKTESLPGAEGALLAVLTEIQPGIAQACDTLEAEKLNSARGRLLRYLD